MGVWIAWQDEMFAGTTWVQQLAAERSCVIRLRNKAKKLVAIFNIREL